MDITDGNPQSATGTAVLLVSKGDDMRNTIASGILILGMTFFLGGCGAFWHDAQLPVQNLMDPAFLNEKLGIEKSDLSSEGQCPGTRRLKVINAETDTDQYIFMRVVGHKHYLIPQTFTELIKTHLEAKLTESGLTLDSDAGSGIEVSFEDAQVEGSMVPEATITLRFAIPAVGYDQTFTAVEGSASGYHALAYVIHLAIDQFVNTDEFKAFIACR